MLMLKTDVPEVKTINEVLLAVREVGSCGITAAYSGYANSVSVSALKEKGGRQAVPYLYALVGFFNQPYTPLDRLIGNMQAPVHLYWERIMEKFIQTGKTLVLFHRVPLEDFPALYGALDSRVGGVQKVIVNTK